MGVPRSQNGKGHVLGHVCDLGLSSDDPNVRIYQTTERQNYHTDSCDVAGLMCLKPAMQGGESGLVSSMAIYNEMHKSCPELLAELLEPMYVDRRGEVTADGLPSAHFEHTVLVTKDEPEVLTWRNGNFFEVSYLALPNQPLRVPPCMKSRFSALARIMPTLALPMEGSPRYWSPPIFRFPPKKAAPPRGKRESSR